MKAVVAAFNQEKALVGAFSVITNLRMEFGWNFLKHYLDVPGLGEVAVSRDVVALLLVEAGAGLDHGQLSAAHAAEGGHHVGQRSQLGGYTVTQG